MSQSRRKFLRDSGIGLLAFYVAGCEVEMSPREARQRELAFNTLQPDEAVTLDLLGDVLLPGSAQAGLAHFIDHQLGAPPERQLLMIKYLGVNPPFIPFYRGGLVALDASAQSLHARPFAELDPEQRHGLVEQMAQENPAGWEGPPAPFFYFVLRGDAVDVVYGTQEGFERLDIPYMAHIVPPSRWGE